MVGSMEKMNESVCVCARARARKGRILKVSICFRCPLPIEFSARSSLYYIAYRVCLFA
jgi:hypothetical protein